MADRYNGTGHRAGVEREGRAIIVAYAQGLLRRRIVRYALVGGIGIPVNLLALALVLHLVGDRLYPLASACAFEVSTSVNFVLNQLYTYGEQKHLRGWEWPRRALKAQMASLSALAIAYVIALALKYGVHLSPYLAQATGIVCAFFYNFTIANRFVFRPAPTAGSESATK
jgi:putative flippase GtrA